MSRALHRLRTVQAKQKNFKTSVSDHSEADPSLAENGLLTTKSQPENHPPLALLGRARQTFKTQLREDAGKN